VFNVKLNFKKETKKDKEILHGNMDTREWHRACTALFQLPPTWESLCFLLFSFPFLNSVTLHLKKKKKKKEPGASGSRL
jgi:hypothetical protein